MNGFLLDVHLPDAIATAGRRLAGSAFFQSIATWQGGIYRHAPDADILAATTREAMVFVTHDKRTMPGLLHQLARTAESHGGVVLIASIWANSPGAIARKLVALSREQDDWTDVVIWLD